MLKVELRKTEDLIEYDGNPRNNERAVEPVMNSIKEFGFLAPVLIDSNDIIIAGHTRKEAAVRLGLKEIPCITVDGLTDEQVKAFRLVDNKTAEFASWDFEKLEDELSDISLDMFQFGFEELENGFIDSLLSDEDLISKNASSDEFSMTLIFPNKYKDDINAFSREELSEIIIREATGNA